MKLLFCDYRSSLKSKAVWDRVVHTYKDLNVYLKIWAKKIYLWPWQICDKKCRRINKILHDTSLKSANDLIKIYLYLPSQMIWLQKVRQNPSSLNVSKQTKELIEKPELWLFWISTVFVQRVVIFTLFNYSHVAETFSFESHKEQVLMQYIYIFLLVHGLHYDLGSLASHNVSLSIK